MEKGRVHAAFSTHFARLASDEDRLVRVDGAEYWDTNAREMANHFPPEVFINVPGLRTPEMAERQTLLAAELSEERLEDFHLYYRGDRLAALFCGHSIGASCYRMWHSHVHPDFAQRGIYSAILRGTIAYTRALGADFIVSDHAPSNNPVLIAKLKHGFHIVGIEVDPRVGLSVNLKFFHNPDQRDAYLFRCGLATLNPRILASGSGAMERLRSQLR
jgi:hypothetical protein